MPQDAKLECRAEATDEQRRCNQCCPEVAADVDRGVADIGTQHEEGTMREVYDAHDAEDEPQAYTEEEEQCGLGQGVQALGDEKAEKVHQSSNVICRQAGVISSPLSLAMI